MDFIKSFMALYGPGENDDYKMGVYPLVDAMCKSLKIPDTIDRVLGERDEHAVMQHSSLVRALIMNMLDERVPLVHLNKELKKVDCEVLFGKNITADLFTEARLGDTLDALSEMDQCKVFSEIALNALSMHGVPIHVCHMDITNQSLSGKYDIPPEKQDENFKIERGHPKSGKKNNMLVSFIGAVQQDGLPILGTALSGNCSEAKEFRKHMNEMANYFNGDLETNPFLLIDAAASNKETFNLSFDIEIPFIIRSSRGFNVANEWVEKAWQEDRWKDVSILAQNNVREAAEYRITSFTESIDDKELRVVVVYSSSLEETKRKTFSWNLPKKIEDMAKKTKKLAKKKFKSKQGAEKAVRSFLEQLSEEESLFEYEWEIKTVTIEKYEKPGRPTPETEKTKITTHHAVIEFGEVNQELFEDYILRDSCFALVSNGPQERITDSEILKEYKKQWKIESKFQFMKIENLLEPIFLHRPNRIKAMLFIQWLAVLVASYLSHRLNKSLQLVQERKHLK